MTRGSRLPLFAVWTQSMLASVTIKSSVCLGQNEDQSNKLLFTSIFQLELNA